MAQLTSPSSSFRTSTVDTTQQILRTFVLTADRIRSLKQKCILQNGTAGSQPPTSTYVAVSSLVWASLVRAKSTDEDHAEDAHFTVVACKDGLMLVTAEPGLQACFARVNIGDLCGEGGVALAARAIQECIREDLDRASDPLEGMDRVLEVVHGTPKERLTSVGSSHRFMAYETDFGWGAPSRVELVSRFTPELVTLLGAKEAGAVQLSVALRRPLMEAFAANFLTLAGSS
ncbi:hypothetical protein CFC21_039246 [Triticum aestivum]|uniref:Uncharacterized protein n=2 Tax=Triticum aestivum TaxID=4565 RepID=A0A9R1FG09_WHEAT|nr:hypothetical protein CFC21_039246 [Triticum aestivum]CDM80637.1 unnamed protein product [Triticum aestivum]